MNNRPILILFFLFSLGAHTLWGSSYVPDEKSLPKTLILGGLNSGSPNRYTINSGGLTLPDLVADVTLPQTYESLPKNYFTYVVDENLPMDVSATVPLECIVDVLQEKGVYTGGLAAYPDEIENIKGIMKKRGFTIVYIVNTSSFEKVVKHHYPQEPSLTIGEKGWDQRINLADLPRLFESAEQAKIEPSRLVQATSKGIFLIYNDPKESPALLKAHPRLAYTAYWQTKLGVQGKNWQDEVKKKVEKDPPQIYMFCAIK